MCKEECLIRADCAGFSFHHMDDLIVTVVAHATHAAGSTTADFWPRFEQGVFELADFERAMYYGVHYPSDR